MSDITDLEPPLTGEAPSEAQLDRIRAATKPFDPAARIDTQQEAAELLSIALADGEPGAVAGILGALARKHGMTAVARATGRGREGLYNSLSRGGDPALSTVLGVVAALGLRLAAVPAEEARGSD